MKTLKPFLPTLYKRGTTGAIQTWTCYTFENSDGHGVVKVIHGQQGSENMQTGEDIIKAGKNVGRANETTPFEQAKAEAKSKWEKKIKGGYSENFDKAESGDKGLPSIDPMLAHPWEKQGKAITFPCHTQPKLDGLRLIAVVENGKARLYSRTRKEFKTLPHIAEQVELFAAVNGLKDMLLDGEAYSDEYKSDFNKIVSIIKRDEIHEDVEKIDYHIYDLPGRDMGFTHRYETLRAYFEAAKLESIPNLVLVQTMVAKSFDRLKLQFEAFVEAGYEGLMARQSDSLYENKRSKGLIKYKAFQDDEFEIVGVQEGKGRLMGHAGSFVCKTKLGHIFNAKMKGETQHLKDYFENFESKCLGKFLTVQYFSLSDGKGANGFPPGIPRFPVGIRLRTDND
jgi:DNA ligase-1